MSTVAQGAAVALLILASLLCGISGSVIDFTGSSSSIKPLVTSNFTVRCALNDTSPSPGSPGAVVGKRSVTSLHPVISEHDVMEAHRNKKDSARSVTSTGENIMMVTSIIISRDGQDLATLIDHFSAKPVNGTSGFTVTGQLTPGDGVKGFLELVWPHPTPQDAGNFTCDVDTLSTTGHHFDFSKTLAVAEEVVTIADLVAQLSVQQMVNDEMKQRDDNLNRTIDQLTQTIANMNRTDAAINNEILQLKSEKVPNVFFTAAYTSGSSSISKGQVVVYNNASVNEGGAYSASTGVFTCPVTGFYHFEFSANTADSDNAVELRLQKNGNFVVALYSYASSIADQKSATNSAIVHLAKGDTVKVVSGGNTFLHIVSSSYKLHTFTGQLIALD